jgi:hypothetical protein
LAKIPLEDVLKPEAQEQALQNLREGTLGQNSDALENAFTPTP